METYTSEWDKYILFNFHPPEKTQRMVELLVSEDEERPRIVFLTGEEGIGRGYFLDAAVYEANQRRRDRRFFVARLDFEGFEENTRSLRDFLKYKNQHSGATAGESFDEKQRFVADLLDDHGKPTLLDAFQVLVLPWLQISLKDLRLWMESEKRLLKAPEREPREAFHVMIEKMCRTGAPVIHIANPEMTPQTIRRWLRDAVRRNPDLMIAYSVGESHTFYDYAGDFPYERLDLWRYDREETAQLVEAKFDPNNFSPVFYDALFRYSQGFPRKLDAAFRSLLQLDVIWQTETGWRSRPDEETVVAFPEPFYAPIDDLIDELDQEGAELFEKFLVLLAVSGGIAPVNHMQDYLGLDEEEKEELVDIVDECLVDAETPCMTDYQYEHPAFAGQLVYGFSTPMLATIILERFRWEKKRVAADFLSYLEKKMPPHTRGQAGMLLSLAFHADRLDQVETGNRLLAWWSDYESAEELKKQLIEEMEHGVLKPETLWETATRNEDIWKPIVIFRLLEAYAAQPDGIPWHMRDRFVLSYARSLFDLGRYEDAYREIQAAMKGFREDEESEIVYQLLYWRGLCRKRLSYFSEAMKDFEKAKSVAEKVVGSNHPNIGAILGSLGSVYEEMGEYEMAREHLSKALDIQMRVYGENHPAAAAILGYLGAVYEKMGEYELAREHLSKALDIAMPVYGENHPEVAVALANLGAVYEKMGEYDMAREHHSKALDITMRVYGENHPDVAVTLGSLGLVYAKMGEYIMAREHLSKSLDIEMRVLGENHPAVAAILGNLGSVYEKMGEYVMAREHHSKALDIKMRVLGDNHPEVAVTLGNLGSVYGRMGEYEMAREHHSRALDIQMRVHGENHPAVAVTLGNLGSVYERMGEHEMAREHHSKALDIKMRVYGDNHPEVAVTLANIGLVYESREEFQEAIVQLDKARQIFERFLPPKHPNIIGIEKALQRLKEKLKSEKE